MCCMSLEENKVLLEEDTILVVTLSGPKKEQIPWSRGSPAIRGDVEATLDLIPSFAVNSCVAARKLSSFFIYKVRKKISLVSTSSKFEPFSPRPAKNYRSEANTWQFSQG